MSSPPKAANKVPAPPAPRPPKPISPILIARITYVAIVVLSFTVLIWTILCHKTDAYQAGIFHCKAHYVASRDLHAFHRLTQGDFYPPPGIPDKLAIELPDPKYLLGAYVLHDVPIGKPIEFDSLSIAPAVFAESGKILRFVPVSEQTQVLDWIEAGTIVQIQAGDKTISAKVLAIRCATPNDRKSCGAIIEVDNPAPNDPDATKWRLWPIQIQLPQPAPPSSKPATVEPNKQGAK